MASLITDETPKPSDESSSFCQGHRYGDHVHTNGADCDEIVAPLFKKALTKLQALQVIDCSLTVTGMRAILEPVVDDKALSRLELLDITGDRKLGVEGACALGAALKKQDALENLQRLCVTKCNATARGLRAILEPIVYDEATPKLRV